MAARRFRWRAGVLLAMILMVGQSIGLVTPLEEARASSADWVDQTFAPTVSCCVSAVVVQPDGRTLIGGWFTDVNGQASRALARLNPDGSLDGSFAPSIADGAVYEIALQDDGKILIGGTFTSIDGQIRRALARLNADGTLDTTFNANLSHSEIWRLNVRVIQPAAGGKMLIGGIFETVGGVTQKYLARLNANGSRDSSLSLVLDSNVMDIAMQPDGKFVVGGYFQTIGGVNTGQVIRLESNGALDATFASGFFYGSTRGVTGLALQPDGKVVVGGGFTSIGSTPRNYVARLNTDGSVDSTFNPGADSYVQDVLIQPDGRIVIGGYFYNAGGQPRRALARFHADGSLDSDFNPSPNNYVTEIDTQSDGKLIIGGAFQTVGGISQARLARLEVAASLPGTQPSFDTPVRTANGFTVNVTNYDPAFSWTPTSTAGAASAGTADDSLLPITVTGLTVGESATVTVATTQAGFSPGSASVTGQAKSAQSVTWSPATALVLPAGSVTPAPGSTTGDGVLSYSVDDSGTTGCSWDDTSGSLSYAAAGTCRVRVLAAETSDYLDDSIVVDFTVSKGAQSLNWAPATALTLPTGSVVPASASALGGAALSYSVDDSGTTGCSWDDTTGALSYAAVGTCRVRVSAAATADYLDDSMTVDFTVAKGTQAVSWSPPSSLTLASLSVDLGHASTSGDGALRYTVDDPGTTGCAIADDTVPLLTYVSAGTCSVTATALATADYLDDSLTTSISIGLATPTMSWAPATALSLPAATVTPASASTTGDGSISYAVTNAGSTGCSWDDTTGSLSYTGAGSCTVTASSLATSRYAAGSVSATFIVSLGTQVVSWSPTTSLRTPGATVTPPAATTSGDGTISYLVTSAGATGCTWDDTTATLTYTSAGSCTVRATASATANYASAFTDVTFTITDPAPAPAPAPGPGPGPAPSPSPTPSPSPSPAPGPDPGTDPSPSPSPGPAPSPSPGPMPTPSPSPSPSPSPGNGSVVSVEGVRVPLVTVPGVGLPPSPARVQVRAATRKSVRVTLPPRVAGSRVLATVVTVLAPDGQVVARVIVQARAGERTAEVSVPFFAKGYTVRVYTVNAVGVSRGGFVTSPLVHDSTIASTSARAKPLLGERLGRPVYFAGGSSWLDRGDRRQLAQIAKAAKAAKAPVFVTGFARKGANTDAVLKRLSTQRARAVAEYLSQRGVRVWIRYWGAGSMGGDGTATDRKVEVRTLASTKIVKAARTSTPTGPADRGA